MRLLYAHFYSCPCYKYLLFNKMSGINWASITTQQRNPKCILHKQQRTKRVALYDGNYIGEVFARKKTIKKSIYRMEIFPYAISEGNTFSKRTLHR